MPTTLDRALNSRSAFIGSHNFLDLLCYLLNTSVAFTGLIGAVAMWSIWGGGDMFPREPDPTGGRHLYSDIAKCMI